MYVTGYARVFAAVVRDLFVFQSPYLNPLAPYRYKFPLMYIDWLHWRDVSPETLIMLSATRQARRSLCEASMLGWYRH